MPNVALTSKEITDNVAAAVDRLNNRIQYINRMPKAMRSQIDMKLFDDIEYLVRYINALHAVIADLRKEQDERNSFTL